ncbi:MAG: hypothetical protein AAFV80_15020 [Bacteroidota bacterium]
MRSRILSLFLFCLSAMLLQAQTDADIIRYAQTEINGTARAMGVGGAFGAIGADFTTASTNPAGIGVYRSRELVLTPGMRFQSIDSDFNGNSQSQNSSRFNFSSAGVVFNVAEDLETNWEGFNVAIGLNRIANLRRDFTSTTTNPGSITTRFLDNANNGFFDRFETQLAFDAGIIFPNDPNVNNCPCSADAGPSDFTEKTINFQSTGFIDELVLSAAGNLNNKWFIGATLGFPITTYEQIYTYSERDPDGSIDFFNSLSYQQQFETTGIGVNFKLGAIYRIDRVFRVGLAVHTPTSFSLTDDFQNRMDASISFDNMTPTETAAESERGMFEYSARTPWRVIASGAAVIRNVGFLTFDAEWVNYRASALVIDSEDPGDVAFQDDVNDQIDQKYNHALNLRIGAEYARKFFRARAGYAFYGPPFRSGVTQNNQLRQRLSGGLGVRFKDFFVDGAIVYTLEDSDFVAYTSSFDSPAVVNNRSEAYVVMTIGIKF